MFSFTNRLWGVGRRTGSRSGTQGEGKRGDNQYLESWQIHMEEAPRDLSNSRGTTGLRDPGCYLVGEDAGQQGTSLGLGFALPEYARRKRDSRICGLAKQQARGWPAWASPNWKPAIWVSAPLAHRAQWHLVAQVNGHARQWARESAA